MLEKHSDTDTLLRIGRQVRLDGKQYQLDYFLGEGGSGQVFRISHGGRQYALKVFFPYYQMSLFSPTDLTAKIGETLEYQRREYEFLSDLQHPNVVRVYAAVDVPLQKKERDRHPMGSRKDLPAIIMEYIDGCPLESAITEYNLNSEQLSEILHRLAKTFQYLHDERRFMHLDVKSSNVLVRKMDFQPVLIDFALCKNFDFGKVSASDTTKLLGDWDLFPKDLPTDHQLKAIKESSGTRKHIYELAFPWLDLFQFGKLLRSLLVPAKTILTSREAEYMSALADQLVDWKIVRYWKTRDLTARIRRLAPDHFTIFGVPELVPPTTTERTITIPPGTAIPITNRIKRVLENRSFRRLMQIHQLALLSYVYPGADYKRSVHLLYSYELARQLTTHLYASPLFRVLFDTREAQQLVVLALLHDINHFPFLHVFQESGIPETERVDILDLFCNGDATGENAAGQPSVYDLLDEVGVDRERFARLVFGRHHEQKGPAVEVDQAMNSILNSGVDVDKLSYLALDSYFTGVSYGSGIDFPGLLKAASLQRVEPANAPHLAFEDRALQALENVVMTRFWNFRSIYWHHTNRALMAMILHVARKLANRNSLDVPDYLRSTMWRSELSAIEYLDDRHEKTFGRKSILANLVEDRTSIYKRVYTVRAATGDSADDSLYDECKSLDLYGENSVRECFADALRDFLSERGNPFDIWEDEVIVDIPRREMDTGGSVFVVSPSKRIDTLVNVSDPVRAIGANYERLVKRVRFFVSPRVYAVLGSTRRLTEREAIQKMLTESVKTAKEHRQVNEQMR